MGAAYITIGIRYGVLDHVGAHAGRKSAFEEAVNLARTYVDNIGIGTIIPEPDEQGDDFPYWVFYQHKTQDHSVIVSFKQVFAPKPTYLPSPGTYVPPRPMPVIHVPKVMPVASTTFQQSDYGENNILTDDPFSDELPAGWFKTGEPAFMSDMKKDPYDIFEVADLTDVQQEALVIARIRKRPNYRFLSVEGPVCTLLFQKEVLDVLSSKDDDVVKKAIIQDELSILNNYMK